MLCRRNCHNVCIRGETVIFAWAQNAPLLELPSGNNFVELLIICVVLLSPNCKHVTEAKKIKRKAKCRNTEHTITCIRTKYTETDPYH